MDQHSRGRDISIVVDDACEDQDELTRGYRGGGNPLATSMVELDQDQIYRNKSQLRSTRNRPRGSGNLDLQSRFDNAQADSKQL